MRCFIFAVDGLDYNFVDKRKEMFPNLIQKYYGKTNLSEFGEELMTPVLWGSFITGSREHSVHARVEWDNPAIKFVKDHLRFLTRKGLGEVLLKSGFRMRWVGKKELHKKTIFDYARDPVVISVPAYNLWDEYYDIIMNHPLTEAIGNEEKTARRLREVWKLEEKKTEIVRKKLQENWDLFMVHYWILDIASHLKYDRPKYMLSIYYIMDELFGSLLKTKALRNALTLVVSDHGTEKGMHTPDGFFSSNKPLGLKNPRITDFFDVILRLLKE